MPQPPSASADTTVVSRPLVVITGGVSGLGLGCALRFAQRGADIVIADINERAAQDALSLIRERNPVIGTSFEHLDLADFDATVATAQRLVARGRAIDVLVNNAGIYSPSQRTLTRDGHELTFAIACLGHAVLTRQLWPLLERAAAARVVSISSLVQHQAKLHLDDLTLAHHYQPIVAYQQAKLACLLFAVELQRRLTASGSRISSYAAHPGVCRTQLGRNRKVQAGDSWFQRTSSAFLTYGLSHFGQTPEQGADSVVLAATSTSIAPGSLVGPTGLMEMFGRPGVCKLGSAARRPDLAQALWQQIEAVTGPWNF